MPTLPGVSDYGHELQFGVFITPNAQTADTVVELAVLADRAGLDLVTFQDHPYQARFLDTSTLLPFVAAATKRVRLAANVLNLPLRSPAVVARAVASLDILSGGRSELGIGAGAFWDGIEAMGGRRLSPGQSVDALEEAIDVIRAIWAVDQPGNARADGTYYSLEGAARGPAPLHDVGIWLGAYKPRMLNLTGRKAGGWLPSLPYLQEGDLARGNAAIDEAAVSVGRDPSEIRRAPERHRRDRSRRVGSVRTRGRSRDVHRDGRRRGHDSDVRVGGRSRSARAGRCGACTRRRRACSRTDRSSSHRRRTGAAERARVGVRQARRAADT